MTVGEKVTFKRYGRTTTGTFSGYALNGVDLKVRIVTLSARGRLPSMTTVVVKPVEIVK